MMTVPEMKANVRITIDGNEVLTISIPIEEGLRGEGQDGEICSRALDLYLRARHREHASTLTIEKVIGEFREQVARAQIDESVYIAKRVA